jgi:histone deacetylase complex regulatory component SIN3
MTVAWKKIYEQNYAKSLDHRSFYFKQAEKKQLLPKTMVMVGVGAQALYRSGRASAQSRVNLRCMLVTCGACSRSGNVL